MRIGHLQRLFGELRFEDMYVFPSFEKRESRQVAPATFGKSRPEAQIAELETKRLSFDEFVDQLVEKKRLVVLGQGGQGKSTLAEYIQFAASCGLIDKLKGYILVFVELGRVETPQSNFLEWAYLSNAEAHPFLKELDDLKRSLKKRFIFILDGLDRVEKAKLRSIRDRIRQVALQDDFKNDILMVTSRYPAYYVYGEITGFDVLLLSDFDKEQSKELFENFLEHLQDSKKRERASKLLDLSSLSPAQRSVVSNPFLASIIFILQVSLERLPERTIELISELLKCLAELTVSGDVPEDGTESEKARQERLKAMQHLPLLAYRMIADNKRHYATRSDREKWLGRDLSLKDIDVFGVIKEVSGIFSFAHDRFLEYFAAYHLAKDDGAWSEVARDEELRHRFREPLKLAPAIAEIELEEDDKAQKMLRELYERDKLLCFHACCEGAMSDDELHRELVDWLCNDFIAQADIFSDEWATEFNDVLSGFPIARDEFKTRFVEPLIEKLGNENSFVRYAAAWALGEIGNRRAIEPLIGTLGDEDPLVHEAAARALGKINDRSIIPHLMDGLNSDNPHFRAGCATALGAMKEARAVELLIKKLKDEDKDVREAAARALGEINDERAVESLVETLRDEKGFVCLAAAEALGKIGDRRAVEPLIEKLRDEDKLACYAAAEALGEINDRSIIPRLMDGLKSNNPHFRAGCATALGAMKEKQAVEPLSERLTDEDSDVRKAAAQALGEIGDKRAVKPLIGKLGDEDSLVRRAVAEALGKINDRSIIHRLMDGLSSDNPHFRAGCATALREMKAKEAVEPLIERLTDEDSDVREAAAEALGKIGDVRAVEPLIERLRDEDWRVRVAAAEALGKIGDVRAVEPLIERLTDEVQPVRLVAAEALGKIGDRRAIGPLEERLQAEKDGFVIGDIVSALKRLRGRKGRGVEGEAE